MPILLAEGREGSVWRIAMAIKASEKPLIRFALPLQDRDRQLSRLQNFPWWLVVLFMIGVAVVVNITSRPNYRDAFEFIRTGIGVTLVTTMSAFGLALVMGLLTGLMRISSSVILKNLATLYVELVRGIPMLVLIFFIALVAVPAVVGGLNGMGAALSEMGLSGPGAFLTSVEVNEISMNLRAVVALSVTYGAFLAEIFRAGIQSIGRGQMEAARSQGMSYWQAMQFIILPQAVRNVLPALGNDFVSMLKDSSLVSILAVRDITQIARLYAGRSFQFQEAYTTLAFIYLTMTVLLSFLVKYLEKRYGQRER